MDDYVELDRLFSKVPKKFKYSDDVAEAMGWGLSKSLGWSELEREYRVVILAEAGSGKTAEIQQAAKRLNLSGKNAFFIRLEYISDGLENAFDSDETGTFKEFEQWQSSDDEAWIFLDSVDEAKLSDPRDFEKAIRKFARKLGSSAQRAHIAITGRVSEWRPKSDLAIFKSQLPISIPEIAKEKIPDHQDIEDDILNSLEVDEESQRNEIDELFKVVALKPLDTCQVRKFVGQCDIDNSERFFEEIERQEVTSYVSRPQDLIELIGFWKENGRIGSRYELIRSDIEKKLEEDDPNRHSIKPLSADRALSGARRCAAAVTFQKQSRIRVPDKRNEAEGVNIATVLDDWQPAEISALLERPIFDQAIYGTVRFHHRTIREFLTADWLLQLLDEGKSRREVEGLLFGKQYGLEVVVPTSRPILPWLALADQSIRDKVLRIAPEILFEGGDPSRLPKEMRIEIIKKICTRVHNEETYRSAIDFSAIRRFATPDLSDTVLHLLNCYRDSNELHTLLLGLVWHAKLVSCRDVAFEIASDPASNEFSRMAAIRALSAVGTHQQIASVIKNITKNAKNAGRRVIGELIECFATHSLSISSLINILKQLEDPEEHGYSALEYKIFELTERFNESELFEFLSALRSHLQSPPFIERRQLEVSKRYAWLLKFATKAAERLIILKSPLALRDDCLAIVSISSLAKNWSQYSLNKSKLRELVPAWPALNRALFWYDVADARRLLDKKKGEELTDWWLAGILRDYWRFESADFDYVADQISEQQLHDNKMVALTLAFQLYKDNNRIRRRREILKKLVSSDDRLSEKLRQLLKPPRMAVQEAKWKAQNAGFQRRQRQRVQKEKERHESSKKWLSKNVGVLRDSSVAAKGTIWRAQSYLYDQMRKSAPDRNRWAYGNWHDLEKEFGSDVATAFRDGAVAYWRAYQPKLRSEGISNPNSVPHAIVLGLCGLEIESYEIELWPSNLGEQEAAKAVRYALWEMNGFPNWLSKLNSAFPHVVSDIFTNEISWELQAQNCDEEPNYLLSDLAWHGQYLQSQIAPEIFNLLEKFTPKHVGTLEKCLTILTKSETIGDAELSEMAWLQVNLDIPCVQKAIWNAVLVSVDPPRGIDALRNQLKEIKDHSEQQTFCMQFAVHLLGDRGSAITARDRYKTVECLKELYVVLHEHIRREDDTDRAGKGVYSPGLRDDAQSARDSIFGILKEIPGKATFLALRELAEDHPHVESRAWMKKHSVDRAVLDSDLTVWSPEDIRDFARDAETHPINHHQLYGLAVSRLLDLKDDLENGDTSVARLLKKAEGETELRNFVGGWLRDRAKNKYSIPQEDELADAKRPDLRFLGNGFDGPVPVELKIADKWTGPEIFERLQNQLCNDYLRDKRSNMGIFLLVHDGTKRFWECPNTGIRMSFLELYSELQNHAENLISDRADIEAISVIGIDLTKRSTPQRSESS